MRCYLNFQSVIYHFSWTIDLLDNRDFSTDQTRKTPEKRHEITGSCDGTGVCATGFNFFLLHNYSIQDSNCGFEYILFRQFQIFFQ